MSFRTDCSQASLCYFLAEADAEIMLLSYIYDCPADPLEFKNAVSVGDWRQLKSMDVVFTSADSNKYVLNIVGETAEEQRFLKRLSENKLRISKRALKNINCRTWLFVDFENCE
jgi:hypothetical protein